MKNWSKRELQVRWQGDDWDNAPAAAWMDVENCGCAGRHHVPTFLDGLRFDLQDVTEQLDIMVFDALGGALKERYSEWASQNGECLRLAQCVEYFAQMESQGRSPSLRLW